MVAIVGGALLLLTRKVKADKVYREDPLAVAPHVRRPLHRGHGVGDDGIDPGSRRSGRPTAISKSVPVLSAITAGLSNLVSNVPAVLVLRPFVAGSADPQRAWLVVAMASTLAGNFTLVGSVANLIVAQRARAQGVDIGFWTYFKVGAPLTLLTIIFGVWWL